MDRVILRDYQIEALDFLKKHWKSAAYMEMGLGKTFIGSEMIKEWIRPEYGVEHIIVLCQKSKIDDWIEHLNRYLPDNVNVINGRTDFPDSIWNGVLVINYDMAITPNKKNLFKSIIKKNFNSSKFGIVCDESSVLQNRNTERSKLMLGTDNNNTQGLGTAFDNVLLLSGTPCNGKYEKLWVQAKILGYEGNYHDWLKMTCHFTVDKQYGWSYQISGYIPGTEVNKIMTSMGSYFLKADDVLSLPPEQDITLRSVTPKAYPKLCKTGVCIDEWGTEIVADTTLKQFIFERKMLACNKNKYETIKDFLSSTDKRVVIGTNFVKEYTDLMEICSELDKPLSFITGNGRNLENYDKFDDNVTIIQYQAGSKGLNLQKGSIFLMSSPPVSAEDYMQSRGRIKREGQQNKCLFYEIIGGELEYRIYETIKQGRDYTLALYEGEKHGNN